MLPHIFLARNKEKPWVIKKHVVYQQSELSDLLGFLFSMQLDTNNILLLSRFKLIQCPQ
jgi:hypothetical protein